MIRLAIIGAGHWGPNLIRNFHNYTRSEVLWVVDRDASRLEEVRRRYQDVRLAQDPRQALADPRVHAVVVATPTSTHHCFVKSALEQGKHVMVEKPITADVKEAEELCGLASKQQRVLMVGHVFVYNEGVRRVREYVQRGDLGRVYYISMIRTNLGPIRMDVNAAWDLAAHDISIADYWLGAPAVSACAAGGSWINRGVEDAIFATLRYPRDVLVNLQVSWLSPRKARDITIVGEKMMLTFDDLNLSEPIRLYDKGVLNDLTVPAYVDTFASFRTSLREGDIVSPRVRTGEPLKNECEHFLDCISFNKEPDTSGRQALTVIRTLDAIQRSLCDSGREQQV